MFNTTEKFGYLIVQHVVGPGPRDSTLFYISKDLEDRVKHILASDYESYIKHRRLLEYATFAVDSYDGEIVKSRVLTEDLINAFIENEANSPKPFFKTTLD